MQAPRSIGASFWEAALPSLQAWALCSPASAET
jgi:hypothetical protein